MWTVKFFSEGIGLFWLTVGRPRSWRGWGSPSFFRAETLSGQHPHPFLSDPPVPVVSVLDLWFPCRGGRTGGDPQIIHCRDPGPVGHRFAADLRGKEKVVPRLERKGFLLLAMTILIGLLSGHAVYGLLPEHLPVHRPDAAYPLVSEEGTQLADRGRVGHFFLFLVLQASVHPASPWRLRGSFLRHRRGRNRMGRPDDNH